MSGIKYNQLIPEFEVSDFDRSLDFYVRVLGFDVEERSANPNHALLCLNGAQLMICDESDDWTTGERKYPYGRGVNFSVDVPDADELVKRIERASYPIMIPLYNAWYRKGKIEKGQRQFLVMDPDGYLLRFKHDLGIRSLPPASSA